MFWQRAPDSGTGYMYLQSLASTCTLCIKLLKDLSQKLLAQVLKSDETLYSAIFVLPDLGTGQGPSTDWDIKNNQKMCIK